ECGRGAAGRHRRPEPPDHRCRTRPADARQPRDQGAGAAGRQLPRAGIQGRRTARAARDGRARWPPRACCRAGRGRGQDAMTGAGAASLAMSGPAPAPVVRGPARSDSAAPPADAASAGAPARDDAAAAVEHAGAERIARPDEHREDTTAAPAQSFAQLLAQAPPAPPPAPAPTPTADASDTGTTNDANAPGDLLALLDGSWSGTSASGAASVPATLQGAQPPAGVSASATVAAAAGAHATLDAEAAPAGAASALALALDVDGAAPSTQAASPALEAAATARDATAATQTGISIEAPTAGIAGSAPLAASRPPTAAPALPPLPLPANPA